MTIKNETIKKLTSRELCDLGCLNIGIIPTNGTPKKRFKDFRAKEVDGVMVYSNEESYIEYQLVPLIDGGYAFRVYNQRYELYIEQVAPLAALNFIK